MNCYYMEPKFIHQKNISYHYTINQYKSIMVLGDIKTIKLSSIASEITDGTRVKRIYTEQGVRIINVGDFKEGQVYLESLKRISKNGLKEKDYIKENDILITSVGKSGQVIKVTPNLEDCVISSDIIRIRLKQPSTAAGLVTYLKSEAGQFALEAIKSGLLHRLSINAVKELKVPSNYKEFAYDKPLVMEVKKEANRLYEVCTRLFSHYIMQETDIFETPKFTYIKENQIDNDRLDPKHYTYTQSELYRVINSSDGNIRWQPLGEVVEIKKAIRPSMDENREVEYINISNIDDDLSIINSNEKDLYKNLSSRIRYVLDENELITAKSGSATGTQKHASALVTNKYAGMMASDAFYNTKTIDIDPHYLLFLLKQPMFLKQIDAGATGLYFKTINRIEFENVRIPRLKPSDESKIVEHMKKYIEILERV